jgi:transmembrane sensor
MMDKTQGKTPPGSSKSDVEAVDWLVAVTEIAADPKAPEGALYEVQARLNAWAASSPANAKSFLETVLIFEALGDRNAKLLAEMAAIVESNGEVASPDQTVCALPAVSSPPRVSATQDRVRVPTLKQALAAAVLVGALLAGMAVRYWVDPGTTYRSLAGERTRIPLQDGSVVFLNELTEMQVSFSNTNRKVSLIRGEALFDVAHDARREFVVHSLGTEIQALGTQFDVRQLPGRTQVVVVEGSVGVNSPSSTERSLEDRHITLVAGDVADASTQTLTRTKQADVASILAWHRADILVVRQPLSAVAELFNHDNRRQVQIFGPVAERRISGTYKTDHPEVLVQALQHLYPDLSVQETSDGWFIESH